MSAFDTAPPSYTDPSVTDDISKLITVALGIQQYIYDARAGVAQVDAVAGTKLLPRLVQLDDKYLKLVNESRTSANNLYSAITSFVDVVVPISQNANYPLTKRVTSVKTAADKIGRAAKEDLRPYDKQVESVKKDLQALHAALVAADDRVKKEAKQPLADLTVQIETLGANIKSNRKLFDRLGAKSKEILATYKKPKGLEAAKDTNSAAAAAAAADIAVPVSADGDKKPEDQNKEKPSSGQKFFASIKSIGSFFEGEAAIAANQTKLDAKIQELANLKKEVNDTSAEIDKVLVEISKLVASVSGIVGKLGHFGVIWDKLVADSAALSDYLAESGANGEAIIERVQSEVEVYAQIRQALDDYCLRT